MSNAIEPYGAPQPPMQQLLPAYAPRAAQSDRIDLRALFNTLRRRLGLFLGVLIATVLISLVITAQQVPLYSATSQVVLNTRPEQVTPNMTGPSGAVLPTPDLVTTEAIVLQSRSLANNVAQALNLDNDPRFNRPRGGIVATLQKLIGLGKPLTANVAAKRSDTIDRLLSDLNVSRLDETYALQIGFTTTDPQLAAKIANEYAVQYTRGQLTQKLEQNRAATSFLAERLEGLRQQAQADTERVQQYRIANNLLSTTGASLTEQEITSYNEQVAGARASAAEDQARLDTARAQLRAGSSGGDVGAALDSQVVGALRTRRGLVGGTLANLEAHYGPRHPDVIKARGELADLDSQIAAEIARVISNLEAKARVSRERLASLNGSLSGAKGTLAQNGRATVGLDDLQRRASTSQALYESYLNRYKETGAQEGAEKADARVISLAEVPTIPTSPHPKLNFVLALLLGTAFGLTAALVAEMTFSGITTGEDVEYRLGQTALGVIPTLGSVQARQVSTSNAIVATPGGPFAEAFRNLRRSIQYAADRPVHTIAISSALPKEGKTTISVCLARSIASGGEQVVLVDCDIRQRGTTRMIGAEGDRPGLIEVLKGEATLDEALLRDEDSGAWILPLPRYPGDMGELIVGEAMDALLAKLRDRFGFVILDTAPTLPVADTRVLATKVDTVVFVVRWRKTSDHAVKAALRLLPGKLSNVAGVVLSRVDMRKQGRFGYGDPSFYYESYKGYYA